MACNFFFLVSHMIVKNKNLSTFRDTVISQDPIFVAICVCYPCLNIRCSSPYMIRILKHPKYNNLKRHKHLMMWTML